MWNNIPYNKVRNRVYWDDQQVTIGAVKKGVSSPTETAYKGSQILSFSKSQDNIIYFQVQITHRYRLNSMIDFHVHNTVIDNNAGDVRWVLTCSLADINGVFPTETTYASNQTIAANSLDTHLFFEQEDIGSSTGVSSIALCSLMREGTHIDDSYDNVIYLTALDFHLQLDTPGSRQETVK